VREQITALPKNINIQPMPATMLNLAKFLIIRKKVEMQQAQK
jgi:hypothetical protein